MEPPQGEPIVISEEDFQKMMHELHNPREPNGALKKAMQKYKEKFQLG
jgi:uncharacterized protein (DUF1778 family)